MHKGKTVKVNLGCGRDYLEGYINIDADKNLKADAYADLSQKFPLKDQSVDELKASDILEHFTKENGEEFLKECVRVLKVGGILKLRTHNLEQIFNQFRNNESALIHFLYGDTSENDTYGSHKYAYTKKTLSVLLKFLGLQILSFENIETNFDITAQKLPQSNDKLNIGIVIQSPDLGGAETYILSLISRFIKKDNKIFFAANKSKFLAKAKELPIKTYEIPFIIDIMGDYKGLIKTILLSPFVLVSYLKFLFQFKKEKVDVILMSGFTEKLLVTFLSVFFKIPVVWIEYGRLETVFKRNFYLPKVVYRLLKDIPKKVLVPSKNTMMSLIKDARILHEKLELQPLGVEVKQIAKTKNLKDYAIGSVSRLTSTKGQDLLIKAFPLVLDAIPSAKLIIVGDGPDKNNYIDLINELNLNGKVILTGFVKNLDEYYQKFDIFVFPTVWELEGFGLVLIEAMSHKIPVVAFATGPVPEIVDDGKTGLVVKKEDLKGLSEAIIKLAKNPSLRKEFGENGYKKVLSKYNLENVSAKMLEILRFSTIS